MVDLIRRLHAEQGVSILFIEHDMDIVFGIAQRITVLDQGRVLADGTPDEISADPNVRAAYLGRRSNDRRPARAARFIRFYGKSHILHGVSLEVNEGEIVAVLGRNGAGKTTTVRSLIGSDAAARRARSRSSATTRRAGRPTGSPGSASATCRKAARSSAALTVLENLKVPQARPGPWTLERVFELFPRLGERRIAAWPATLRRRAGNAGDRPAAAAQPAPHAARRAVARARTADRARR